MPVNADIYRQYAPAPTRLATLGELAQARDQREVTRQNREITDLNLDLKRREIAEKDTAAQRKAKLQEIIAQNTGPDGPDFKKIIPAAYAFDAEAGQELEKYVNEQRKALTAQEAATLKNDADRKGFVSRLLQGVDSDEAYQIALPALRAYDQKYGDNVASRLGPTFSPRVQQVAAEGLSHSEWAADVKRILDSEKDNKSQAREMFAAARTPEQWEYARGFAKFQGIDDDLKREGIPDQFSADAAEYLKRTIAGATKTTEMESTAARAAADDKRADAQLSLSARQVAVAEGNLAARRAADAKTAADGGVKLSAGQQQDLETMLTVSDTIGEIKKLGEETGWSGTGAGYTGSIKQGLAKTFGVGDAKSISLRNKINNVKATIAKLRGGTAFTPNEQALLESYTPTIDDGDIVLKQKLTDLESFIETKRKNMLKIASGDLSPNAPAGLGISTTTAQQGARVNPFKK